MNENPEEQQQQRQVVEPTTIYDERRRRFPLGDDPRARLATRTLKLSLKLKSTPHHVQLHNVHTLLLNSPSLSG